MKDLEQRLRPRRAWCITLPTSLAILGVLLLFTRLGASHAEALGTGNPWPLTTDGRFRFAGWSPDGRTVLVNRWGTVVGDGAHRQALGELWAVDVRGGPATRLSENAVQPAYTDDGQRLAFMAFTRDGQWEARVLDLHSGQEQVRGPANWRMPPAWVGGKLAFARAGQVWLSHEGAMVTPANLPTTPTGARIHLNVNGNNVRAAWSDGMRLWAQPHPGEAPRLLVAPHPQPLSSNEGEANTRVLNLAWSPDGRRLAYVLASDDLSPALWVVDVAGGKAPVRLTQFQGQMEILSAPSWSPDGRTLAFSRTPLGAETASASDLWLVSISDGQRSSNQALHPLLKNDLEESNPAWSPDGRYLAFNRAGDVWILDLTQPISIASSPHEKQTRGDQPTNPPIHRSPTTQQTPPSTIRVIHHEANYYRDVPAGQIDVIPFEEYVKRCVPVEMPASWPNEALQVQAMAARTYAWYYTGEHAGWDWDVSDWTDYQVMGSEDNQHPRSDAATDATQGQYIAYRGDVIKAFYSAENGCPTRGLDEYDYIQAVDDPVSFGQERRGHGWGMSQWGAHRWAAWHGWGYQQILAHYYTGVTIELPSTGGPLPLGGVTRPWSNYFATGNRVHLVANGSDEAGDVSAVGFYAVTDTTTLLITDTVGDDGWSTVWDISALNDTSSSAAITLSLRVADGAGNLQTETQTARIGLDRQPPTATTAVINGDYTNTVTVTLSSLSATDPSPGSDVQAMAFSNEGWNWEGEELYHLPNTGEAVKDTDALNGWAWRGLADTHTAGIWYGPYTYDLPPGHAYRAIFRLKTNDATTTTEVATLDVVDDGGEHTLGLRHLQGTDFCAADAYQEFPVDFGYTDAGSTGLEFRVAFHATADLYLDRVLIAGYPITVAPTARWQLTPDEGLKTVTVKFIDGAGNVSADLTRTITLDTSPPTGWHDFAPEQWDGGPPPTCTVRVRDIISGLDVGSARYRFSEDRGVSWSDWVTASCTGDGGTTETQTINTAPLPFGMPRTPSNLVQFQVTDLAGLTGAATYVVRGPLNITGPSSASLADTSHTFTASVNLLTGTVVSPITYTWQATGQPLVARRSGLSDTMIFTWTIPGPKTITVTATNEIRAIGSAIHDFTIEECVYLPLVMRDWSPQGSLRLPPSSFPLFTTRHF